MSPQTMIQMPLRIPVLLAMLVSIAGAPIAGASTARDDQNRRRDDAPQAPERQSAAEERITRTFQLAEGGALDLSNIAGEIVVTSGRGRELRIEAVKRVRERSGDAAQQLSSIQVDINERAGRVEVRTLHRGNRNRGWVDYTVSVPSGISVKLRSISGDMRIDGVPGAIDAESISGTINATKVREVTALKSVSGDVQVTASDLERGGLTASTVSGNLTVTNLKASNLELGTVSGELAAADITSPRAAFNAVSGDVRFSGRLVDRGRYEFKSHSGNVTLTLDERVGFELEGTTFSGNVVSDLPLTLGSTQRDDDDRRRGRNRAIRGTFGNGSAFIELTSFSGNISIHKRP